MHAEVFSTCVSSSGLLLPDVFPCVGTLKVAHALDRVAHLEREKSFKHIQTLEISKEQMWEIWRTALVIGVTNVVLPVWHLLLLGTTV